MLIHIPNNCISDLARQTWLRFLLLTRTGAEYIDLITRKDGKVSVLQADFLKYATTLEDNYSHISRDDLVQCVANEIDSVLFTTHGYCSSQPMTDVAEAAIKAMQIQEITLEQAARLICFEDGVHPDAIKHHHPDTYYWQDYIPHAKALAKLGTIRIKE